MFLKNGDLLESKVCPSCGSENDRIRINCWNCGASIQSSFIPKVVESSFISKVVELNTNSTIQLAMDDDSVIHVRPKRSINCDNCNSLFVIEGMGVFICPNCHQENNYIGPFKIDCEPCSIRLVIKQIMPSKPVIKCPNCGQKYHIISHYPKKKTLFKKIWEFYKSLHFLQG